MRRLIALFLLLSVSYTYGQDLQKGHTFNDGDTIHGGDLNNLVDLGALVPTVISGKTLATPATADSLLFFRASDSSLKRATFGGVFSLFSLAMPTEFTVTGNGTATISVTKGTQTGNTVYAAPNVFVGAPSFRALLPWDITVVPDTTSTLTFNWAGSNVFSRTLASNTNFSQSNPINGESVVVKIKQAAAGGPFTASFPGVFWPGNVVPVQTTRAGATDIYTFVCIDGIVYGSVVQNF